MCVMPSAVTVCRARSASATSTSAPRLRSTNTPASVPSGLTSCAYTTALPPLKMRNFPGATGANCPARSAALRRLSARAVASGASNRVSHANPAVPSSASSATGR